MLKYPKLKCFLVFLFLFLLIPLSAQELVFNELMSANKTSVKDEDGDFSDWIEIYNPQAVAVNLENYCLSDNLEELNKWSFPNVSIAPKSFLVVFLSGKNKITVGEALHTKFKLKSTGERIILSNNLGSIIDQLQPVSLKSDCSYGRFPDGSNDLGFLTESTLGETNNLKDTIRFIRFSHPQGFSSTSFDLEMTCSDSVYYTLDGSLPSIKSTLFESSIVIADKSRYTFSKIPREENNLELPKFNRNLAVIIRAQPFRNGTPSGPVQNRTYFTQEYDYTFNVLSVLIEKNSLFNHESGIYTRGIYFNPDSLYWSGNYFQRGKYWERPCSVSFFDESGNAVFEQDMGVRIAGRKSRCLGQKSLRFYMRNEYGKSSISNSFFPNREYRDIKRFVARSPVSSWFNRITFFKDEMIHSLASRTKLNLDVQMSRPTVLYLNGEYWGIQTLRERQNKHYLESVYGIDKDSIDIIEGSLDNNFGDSKGFEEVFNYIKINDLSIPKHYNYITNHLDIDNFIDYYIVEIYFGNRDWPWNNLRLWRPRVKGGKWRFLLYDLDASIGEVSDDSFGRFIDLNDDQSFVFKQLLLNKVFRDEFICRFKNYLVTIFSPDALTDLNNKFIEKYVHELPRHMQKWNIPKSVKSWENSCAYNQTFFEQRPSYIRKYLIKYFDDFSCDEDDIPEISIHYDSIENKYYLKLNNLELIDGSISIYDSKGLSMIELPLYFMTQELHGVDLQRGLYIVEVRKNDVFRTAKLIVH